MWSVQNLTKMFRPVVALPSAWKLVYASWWLTNAQLLLCQSLAIPYSHLYRMWPEPHPGGSAILPSQLCNECIISQFQQWGRNKLLPQMWGRHDFILPTVERLRNPFISSVTHPHDPRSNSSVEGHQNPNSNPNLADPQSGRNVTRPVICDVHNAHKWRRESDNVSYTTEAN